MPYVTNEDLPPRSATTFRSMRKTFTARRSITPTPRIGTIRGGRRRRIASPGAR